MSSFRNAVPVQPEVTELAVEAAKRGAFGISRLRTSKLFTFEVDGDDVLLSDALRESVEGALGEPLIEKTFPGYAGQVNLVPKSQA